MTINLGAGTLWTRRVISEERGEEWVPIGSTGATVAAIRAAGEEQGRSLRAVNASGSIMFTLTSRQTGRLFDVLFPGVRWQLSEGRRARCEYDRRRRARRRRNRR